MLDMKKIHDRVRLFVLDMHLLPIMQIVSRNVINIPTAITCMQTVSRCLIIGFRIG